MYACNQVAQNRRGAVPNQRIKLPACGTRSHGKNRRLTHAAAYPHRYKDMMISQNLQRRSLQMPTEWIGPRPQVPSFAARRLFLGTRADHGKGLHFLRKQGGGQSWGRREPGFPIDLSMSSDVISSWSSCSSYTGKVPRIAGLPQKGLVGVPVVDRPLSNFALQPSPGAVGVLAQVVA